MHEARATKISALAALFLLMIHEFTVEDVMLVTASITCRKSRQNSLTL
jgi:hypothetical protein